MCDKTCQMHCLVKTETNKNDTNINQNLPLPLPQIPQVIQAILEKEVVQPILKEEVVQPIVQPVPAKLVVIRTCKNMRVTTNLTNPKPAKGQGRIQINDSFAIPCKEGTKFLLPEFLEYSFVLADSIDIPPLVANEILEIPEGTEYLDTEGCGVEARFIRSKKVLTEAETTFTLFAGTYGYLFNEKSNAKIRFTLRDDTLAQML